MKDPTRERWTAFVDAAQLDNALANEMLLADPSLLEMPGVLGETPLHFLAIEAFADGVRYLISKGANINCVNEFGNSALQEAVVLAPRLESVEIVRILLDAGANPYHHSDAGACGWHAATRSDMKELSVLFQHLPPPRVSHGYCDLDA